MSEPSVDYAALYEEVYKRQYSILRVTPELALIGHEDDFNLSGLDKDLYLKRYNILYLNEEGVNRDSGETWTGAGHIFEIYLLGLNNKPQLESEQFFNEFEFINYIEYLRSIEEEEFNIIISSFHQDDEMDCFYKTYYCLHYIIDESPNLLKFMKYLDYKLSSKNYSLVNLTKVNKMSKALLVYFFFNICEDLKVTEEYDDLFWLTELKADENIGKVFKTKEEVNYTYCTILLELLTLNISHQDRIKLLAEAIQENLTIHNWREVLKEKHPELRLERSY